MIIARSPFRISLGGGGTDLPSYYRDHEGFVIAAAIDRYMYIMVHHRFVRPIFLKYSKLELVDRVDDIEHPIIREALKAFPNFQVAGRNGMHKYNNQDHSMMSALIAARRLQGSPLDPWNVNTDAEYHEEGSEKPAGRQVPGPA